MMEIIAKDNATIQSINNRFPLGQRDTIKIHIEDEVIKSRLNLQGTGQCFKKFNLFSYGYFDNRNDLNNVEYFKANYHNASGINGNTSRCLYVCMDNKVDSYVKFKSSKTLKPGVEYTFSFLCTEDLTGYILTNIHTIENIEVTKSKLDGWYLHKSDKFTVDETVAFDFILNGFTSEFYIDNISVFEADKEILDSADIEAEIEITNPKQDLIIDNLVKWYKDDNDTYVILCVPSITVVDYRDSITCKLNIFEPLAGRYKKFGNVTYTKCRDTIYQSELFNLEGYILRTDVNLDVEEI